MTRRERLLAVLFMLWELLAVRSEAAQPGREETHHHDQPVFVADNSPTEVPPDTTAPLLSLGDAISLALQHSPTLHAARQQVAGKTAQITEAAARFLPNLTCRSPLRVQTLPRSPSVPHLTRDG